MGREEPVLAGRSQVAGEEQREPAPVEAKHERFLVLAPRRRLVERSRAIGPQHGQEHRSEPESLSSRERSPARTRTLDGTEGVLRPCDPAPVFPKLVNAKAGENGAQPARVIGIRM